MLVTVPPELLVALHGKLSPLASIGLLLGVPYGGGLAMTMWALAVEAMRAMAEAERAALMEGMFVLFLGVAFGCFVCLLCEWMFVWCSDSED